MRLYTNPYTRAQYQLPENETYSVYIRRSNGNKRLMMTSKSPDKAFEFFHTFRIYLKDTKYIYANTSGELKDGKKTPLKLATIVGTEPRPSDHTRLGAKIELNYKAVVLPAVTNVPETLAKEIKKLTSNQIEPGSINTRLSRNKLIPLLLAYFASLDVDQRHELIEEAEKHHLSHKYKSGANITPKIQDLIDNEIIPEEDLL